MSPHGRHGKASFRPLSRPSLHSLSLSPLQAARCLGKSARAESGQSVTVCTWRSDAAPISEIKKCKANWPRVWSRSLETWNLPAGWSMNGKTNRRFAAGNVRSWHGGGVQQSKTLRGITSSPSSCSCSLNKSLRQRLCIHLCSHPSTRCSHFSQGASFRRRQQRSPFALSHCQLTSAAMPLSGSAGARRLRLTAHRLRIPSYVRVSVTGRGAITDRAGSRRRRA